MTNKISRLCKPNSDIVGKSRVSLETSTRFGKLARISNDSGTSGCEKMYLYII